MTTWVKVYLMTCIKWRLRSACVFSRLWSLFSLFLWGNLRSFVIKGVHSKHWSDWSDFVGGSYWTHNYSEPSLQRQHLFSNVAIKMNLLLYRILNGQTEKYKRRFIFISSQNICFGYLLESPHWGDSNKYPKHMLLEVLMQYSCIICH